MHHLAICGTLFPDSLKAFGRPIGVLDPASMRVKDSVCGVGLNALAL